MGCVPAEQPRHGGHVVGDRQVREKADLLDDVAHATPQADRVALGDVVTREQDAPARRLDQPVDHLEGGRLAAPRRADEHAHLALVDVEVQLVDGDDVAEALGDALEPQHPAERYR